MVTHGTHWSTGNLVVIISVLVDRFVAKELVSHQTRNGDCGFWCSLCALPAFVSLSKSIIATAAVGYEPWPAVGQLGAHPAGAVHRYHGAVRTPYAASRVLFTAVAMKQDYWRILGVPRVTYIS